ncbi:MAG: isoprenylcysteine carboxylmethyltransferase family protein [Bryobacteraceae bacterium]
MSASSAFTRWPASTPATAGRNSARPGIALELLGFVPICLAIAENPFLERHVRVQTELGHRVITTGPYRVVRHPMYSGLMLLLPGCALVLGSAWSFAPITMLMATFIVRTVLERRRPVPRIAGLQGVLHTDTLPTGSRRVVRPGELLYDGLGHIRRGRAAAEVGRARAAFLQTARTELSSAGAPVCSSLAAIH